MEAILSKGTGAGENIYKISKPMSLFLSLH